MRLLDKVGICAFVIGLIVLCYSGSELTFSQSKKTPECVQVQYVMPQKQTFPDLVGAFKQLSEEEQLQFLDQMTLEKLRKPCLTKAIFQKILATI